MSTREFVAKCLENLEDFSGDSTPQYKSFSAKLSVYDWLKGIPKNVSPMDIVEVRFKNTRKGFYKNVNQLKLEQGDLVAVEASPGHDIGIVCLTGELVHEQLKKNNINLKETEFKKIYRKAKVSDLSKWKQAIEKEQEFLVIARESANGLKLDMKIGDVEFQGDKTKAIFYYIADERIDFRDLIKVLAEKLHIRIEMRQVGARQEAGRIGGIGPCGRELCCTTWLSNFSSVTTNTARKQDLSLNPQKLAGQCGKLKCCLNYELSTYIDIQKGFPSKKVPLETEEGIAYYRKADILRQIMWYSFNEKEEPNEKLTPVSVERVKEIIRINKGGKKAYYLVNTSVNKEEIKADFQVALTKDSISRFDGKKKFKKKKKKNKRKKNTNNQ